MEAAAHRRRRPDGAPFIARLVALCAVLVLLVTAAGSPAAAHQGDRALPGISVRIANTAGPERVITVRVSDRDGGGPVTDATVDGQADMTRPHRMNTFFGPLPEIAPGVYRGRVRFPMPADWRIAVRVSGDAVVPAEATTALRIAPLGAAPAAATGADAAAPVRVRVEERLAGRDVASVTVLWLHAGAALAWIVGVAVITLAAGLGWLSPAAAAWLQRRRRAVVVLFAAALPAVILLTGLYNVAEVSPVSLLHGWSSGLDRFADLYRLTFAVKVGLFAVILLAGGVAVRRVAAGARSPVRPAVALIALAPVLLMSAVALRYLHILTHVAEAAGP